MPCCICEAERLSYREAMNATTWFICDVCRDKVDRAQVETEQAETNEPDPCDVAEQEPEYVAAVI